MKAYLKPVLYYERFELSQHIASCSLVVNFNMALGSECTGTGIVGGEFGISVKNGFVDGSCKEGVQGYCYTASAEITGTHAS